LAAAVQARLAGFELGRVVACSRGRSVLPAVFVRIKKNIDEDAFLVLIMIQQGVDSLELRARLLQLQRDVLAVVAHGTVVGLGV
jgi:hypothetical protein